MFAFSQSITFVISRLTEFVFFQIIVTPN